MSETELVKQHYLDQARALGKAPESTMPDKIVRAREIEAILTTLKTIAAGKPLRILEIGCGNGTLLDELARAGYRDVVGVDFLPEFVELAKSRGLPFDIRVGDICALPFNDAEFDVVLSERVIINVKDQQGQHTAFHEVRRVLKDGGYIVMIEALEDAWHNLNSARNEFGLEPIPMPAQNRWFKAGELEDYTAGIFSEVTRIQDSTVTPRNFLSSHYFMTRVMHALFWELRKQGPDQFEGPVRNTHFAQFFALALPPVGNYAPVQFVCMKAV